MINKKYIKGFIPVLIICCALMGVGAVYDFKITDTLYNPNNTICILFEAFAKLPIFIYLPILGTCMVIRNRKSTQKFLIGALLMLVSWALIFYFSSVSLAENGLLRRANPYICGILGGIASRATFIILRGAKRETVKKIQSICVFAFFMMLGYIGGIGGLKVLCGRDRYRDIITGGEYAFARWFKPDFLSGGSSFPSGHTARAMGILTILLLPFVFEYFKNKKTIMFVISYVYAFCVRFTRLVLGRHFLSDVTMSIICMTIGFMILTPFYESVCRKELIEKPPITRKKKK